VAAILVVILNGHFNGQDQDFQFGIHLYRIQHTLNR
jgi:hypothetical protein